MKTMFALCLTLCTLLPASAAVDLWVQTVQPRDTTIPPPPNGTLVVDFVITNIGNQTAFNFWIAGS